MIISMGANWHHLSSLPRLAPSTGTIILAVIASERTAGRATPFLFFGGNSLFTIHVSVADYSCDGTTGYRLLRRHRHTAVPTIHTHRETGSGTT